MTALIATRLEQTDATETAATVELWVSVGVYLESYDYRLTATLKDGGSGDAPIVTEGTFTYFAATGYSNQIEPYLLIRGLARNSRYTVLVELRDSGTDAWSGSNSYDVATAPLFTRGSPSAILYCAVGAVLILCVVGAILKARPSRRDVTLAAILTPTRGRRHRDFSPRDEAQATPVTRQRLRASD